MAGRLTSARTRAVARLVVDLGEDIEETRWVGGREGGRERGKTRREGNVIPVQEEDEEEDDEEGGGLEEVRGVSKRTHPGCINCWLIHSERTRSSPLSLSWFSFSLIHGLIHC